MISGALSCWICGILFKDGGCSLGGCIIRRTHSIEVGDFSIQPILDVRKGEKEAAFRMERVVVLLVLHGRRAEVCRYDMQMNVSARGKHR